MIITEQQLKRLILESLSDLFLSNANAANMADQGGANYEDAEKHARKVGKAYFVQYDDDITELIKDPDTNEVYSNIIDRLPDKKDAKIFYHGDI